MVNLQSIRDGLKPYVWPLSKEKNRRRKKKEKSYVGNTRRLVRSRVVLFFTMSLLMNEVNNLSSKTGLCSAMTINLNDTYYSIAHISFCFYCLRTPNQCIHRDFVSCMQSIFDWLFAVNNHLSSSTSHSPGQVVRGPFTRKPWNDTLKARMHHVTGKPHAVNFLIAFCFPQLWSGERKHNMVFIYVEFLSVSQLGECARELGYGTEL